ncbi:MAG: CpaF family protein [Euryarchaeota archaeon]|nr:CpaF family protein [Euryarchaeota archaeon]
MGDKGARVVNLGNRYFYRIELPTLTPREMKFLKRVKDAAIKEAKVELRGLTKEQVKQRMLFAVLEIMDRLRGELELPPEKREKLAELIVNDMVGYGLLEPLLEDDEIEEIMVIGPKRPVYVFHRKYGMLETNVVFQDPQEIVNIIQRIASSVGRRIDASSPLLDARLPDGSRVNATLSPPALDGPTLTIRKFKKDPLTVVDLIRFNTMSSEVAAFLWLMVDGFGISPKNILIAGGTGSGKTTTLNALAVFIRERERVITIEDTAELQLPIKHLVRFEVRPPSIEGRGEIDMNTLLKNTLRMRPDRIIIGEVRGEEAKTLFTAMNTGHNGTLATLHANSARECITRLTNEPMNVPLIMIPALDLIVMQARFTREGKGSVRRITEVTEVDGLREGTVALSKLYEYDPLDDTIKDTGTPSELKQELARQAGVSVEEVNRELERRRLVLDYLVTNNIREIYEVRRWVESYYSQPDTTLKKIETSLRTVAAEASAGE